MMAVPLRCKQIMHCLTSTNMLLVACSAATNGHAICCLHTCKRPWLSTAVCCWPGRPEDSGISLQAVRELGTEFPLFGVCMGHQCIGQAFGGRVVRAPCGAMHGKTSLVHHTGKGVLQVRHVVCSVVFGPSGCLAAWLGQMALLAGYSLHQAAGVAASLARPGDGVPHTLSTVTASWSACCRGWRTLSWQPATTAW